MKAVVLVCSIIILLLTSFNCKSPTTPGGKGISIFVADVGCTEVWLNLCANNVILPANIIIKKNGNKFINLNLTTKDTTLYDSTLLPSQTYMLQSYCLTANPKQPANNKNNKSFKAETIPTNRERLCYDKRTKKI